MSEEITTKVESLALPTLPIFLYTVVVKLPAIIVNFKAYEQACGPAAVTLAKLIHEVAMGSGASIGVAVGALDSVGVLSEFQGPVFAQHVDPVGFGSHTGHLPAILLKKAGLYGTLLNHAERRLKSETLRETIRVCREVGLYTLVCAESPEKVLEIVEYNPDAIAYEPPELIGGSVSVSTAQPEIIANVVKLAGAIPLFVGAGVKNENDVRVALQLGAQGVLLASGVVLSPDPKKVLYTLIDGLS